MNKPEYKWQIGEIRFEVWQQNDPPNRPPDFACKVIHAGGYEWLSHKWGVSDTVGGCAFQAMCWLEDNSE